MATASHTATASASPAVSPTPKSNGITVSIGATPTSSASPSASASPTPTAFPRPRRPFLLPLRARCDPRVFFRLRYTKPVDLFLPNSYFVDGPGGDIQVWLRRAHLVRLHVELEKETAVDTNIQNFVARVRKDLHPEVEDEHSIEAGHQYTVHVTKGMIGHVRYRVFGLKIGFDEWKIYHNCGRLLINSGAAVFPTIREGWKFWETKTWPAALGGRGGRGAGAGGGGGRGQGRVGGVIANRTLRGRRTTNLERLTTSGPRGPLRRHGEEYPSRTAGIRR
ncbi:hypothetical protein [Actinoallomurus rhizosphaericola]|uniref:hypothetical protein n=1 Tax=Actinoallomurus rhizosphaericola TaxID=2952536 RepID=UPI00209004EF|nr:hypothetical protein [Actinoallomurus rhizosphaericola]MCO5992235.1 hypothetical protein [Actinoallomurus rhizosphaericola]